MSTKTSGNESPMLAAALHYACAGYRVLPLTPRGKIPRLKQWTTGACLDAQQIKKWWTEWPDSNLGLMPPEGCIVVDVDPRNGGSVKGLQLPERTPTQDTGGGGTHYVVRIAKDATLPKLPGVDYIWPSRKQFVAWPSLHPSGKQYRWAPGRAPWDVTPARWQPPGNAPAAAQAGTGVAQPDGLLPVPVARPPRFTCDQLRALGHKVHQYASDRWGNGQHDNWIREWVMPVHYETSGSDEGLALAHEISALFSAYDAKVLDAKWETLGREPSKAMVTGATLEFAVRQFHKKSQPSHGGIPVESVADFASAARPQRWLVRGWLPAGALAVLLGEANAGKSAVSVALGLSIAAGAERFCGQAISEQGAVLYVIAEGQLGMRARARIYGEKVLGLKTLDGIGMFFIPVAISLSEEAAVERVAAVALDAVRAWAVQQGKEPPPIVLVVVDTLARNIGGDAHESDNADMSRVMNNCARLSQLLAELHPDGQLPAVLLNAHPGHSDKSRLRGASAVQGAVDVILRIEVEAPRASAADDEAREMADLLGDPVPVAQPRVMRITKARDSACPLPMRLRLMLDTPTWLRDPESSETNSTVYLATNGEFEAVGDAPTRSNRKVTDDQILAAISAQPSLSQRGLASQLGLSRPALADRLETLRRSGKYLRRGR